MFIIQDIIIHLTPLRCREYFIVYDIIIHLMMEIELLRIYDIVNIYDLQLLLAAQSHRSARCAHLQDMQQISGLIIALLCPLVSSAPSRREKFPVQQDVYGFRRTWHPCCPTVMKWNLTEENS